MNDELGVARNMNERMLTSRRSTIYIPEDLVVEILSRVPLASLARLRWVSKEWNALIKDKILAKKPSQFIMLIDSRVRLVSIDLHKIKRNKVKLTSRFSLKDPVSSEEVNIRDVFHCDGLLLCSTKDKRLVVWNPCSGETRWIQPRSSYKKLDSYVFSKTSCSKYKILRMYQFEYTRSVLLEFEIYDFTSNSWKVVGETRDWFIGEGYGRGMSVNGTTYWIATSENKSGDFLLSFDLTRERFGRESLPGDYLSYFAIALSVTREGQQLCLLATRGSKIYDVDVWIATNGVVMSWSKFLSIDVDLIPDSLCDDIGASFLVDKEKRVLVWRCGPWVSNNLLHIVGEDRCIKVKRRHAKCRCSLVVSYVPSFVQIQPTGFF